MNRNRMILLREQLPTPKFHDGKVDEAGLCQRIPLERILHRTTPVSLAEENTFDQRNKTEGNSNTGPKAIQAPIEPKSRSKADGHRNGIVTKQLNPSSYSLSAQTAE